MSEDSHDPPTGAQPCSDALLEVIQEHSRLRSDVDRLLLDLAQCGLERDAFRSQLATMRAALETARATLKHAAVDGSPDALAVLDLVAIALDPTP